MSDRVRANNEHHIETMEDLLIIAETGVDLDGLFEDLRTWVTMGAIFRGMNPHIKWRPTFIWKDDGERGVSGVRINFDKEGTS